MKPQNIQKPHVIHVEGYVRFLSDTPSCASRRDQKFHNFAHADARSAGAQALAKNSQFPLSIARSAGARALTARPLRGGSRAGGTCCTRTMIFPPNAGSRPIANPRRDTCGQAAGGTSLHCPAAGAPAPTAVTGAYTKQLSLARHSKRIKRKGTTFHHRAGCATATYQPVLLFPFRLGDCALSAQRLCLA